MWKWLLIINSCARKEAVWWMSLRKFFFGRHNITCLLTKKSFRMTVDLSRVASVLWHCWLGLLTYKTVPDMTYNVFGGTLNLAQFSWCRRRNFVLKTKTDDRNFIVRQLFRDIYWHPSLFLLHSYTVITHIVHDWNRSFWLIDWLS